MLTREKIRKKEKDIKKVVRGDNIFISNLKGGVA